MAKKTVVKQPGNNLGGATGNGFKPGKSGNPKGRPKNEFSITALLREAMSKRTIDGVIIPEGLTVGQAIRNKLLNETINGNDFRYLKEIMDRIDGKPKEPKGDDDGGSDAVDMIRKALNGEPV